MSITVTFHEPVAWDGWLLYHHESTQVGAGMSFVRGQVFTEEGVLLASFSQEGMIRGFGSDPDARAVPADARLCRSTVTPDCEEGVTSPVVPVTTAWPCLDSGHPSDPRRQEPLCPWRMPAPVAGAHPPIPGSLWSRLPFRSGLRRLPG